jgi:hypothetical protein
VHYRINAPKVIHQIFDTEVVIVNLETGNYYSLSGSGIEVWRRLDAGFSSRRIVDDFSVAGAPAEKLESFIEELVREQLIMPTEEQAPAAGSEQPASGPFLPPVLEKFTDMREMLLVDPIHELDESGWPKPAALPEQK